MRKSTRDEESEGSDRMEGEMVLDERFRALEREVINDELDSQPSRTREDRKERELTFISQKSFCTCLSPTNLISR